MIIDVSNKIRISEPLQEVREYCENELVLANPDFAKKERMGLWTGNTPRTITLYERDGDDLILPFGCLWDLHKYVEDAEFRSHIGALRRFNYESHVSLYSYQKDAVQRALRSKNGIVVMPCGAGKTQTGLEIVSQIGGKCLWLTHTQDLLNQSMKRAASVYGCDPRTFGTITGGKVNIGKSITFATVQTMAKLNLSLYKDVWDIVIVDECHRAVGSPTKVMQFYKVLSNLCCRYKFGLTATPKRSDGLHKSMFALIGGIVCEVSKEEVAHTTCPVRVSFVDTGYKPDLDAVLLGDGTINYASLVDDLTHNKDRFWLVLETIEKLPPHSPTLVLANRVEYLQKMREKYWGAAQCISGAGNSKRAKEERKRALQALNDGDIDCLFATYQLAKEGLDVPNLRYVVFATPEKDETTVMQAAGRVGRRADGKEYGTVIDFVDSFGLYLGWCKRRNNIYRKKLGYEVN